MRTEDGYIIRKCLNGNSAAFGFLVDKYKAAVYAFAYSELGNFHDAEDITQEVFVKAYQKLNTLRRWDNFLAWLYSITSNLCKMFIRARARRPDSEFIADQEPGTLGEPTIDPRHENPVMELLSEALDSLPETYRRVLTLYYLGGMNSVEIARFLGTSPTAVRHKLSRGRSQLKEGMLAMMSKTLEGQRLQASFTFRIVEAVRRTKINPMPRATALPWGLSLAAGIIITVMSLGQHLTMLNPMSVSAGSSLPVKMKVLKTGEIPVDILDTSQISVIASKQGEGNGEKPDLTDPQKIIAMAPQANDGTWTKKADMPTARANLPANAGVVNGKIYVIGGRSADANLSTVEEYDPAKDKWTTKADMPTARRGLAICTLNGNIYAIGGWSGLTERTSAMEEYDPARNIWTKKANMPGGGRGSMGAAAVNGKIYAIGGWGAGVPLSIVEEYDPLTDKWARKTDMPKARGYLSDSVVDGNIYAIGGDVGVFQNPVMVSTVEEYDPVTDTWTTKADMPTARGFLSTSVVAKKVYAIGGSRKGGSPPQNDSSAVEEYDPTTDTWARKTSMAIPRWGLSTAEVNGKIYAIGGGNVLSTVEEYTPEGWPFQQSVSSLSPQDKLPTKRGEVKSD